MKLKFVATVLATLLAGLCLSAPLRADDLMIYPKGGQSGEQQEKDKFEFYSWAKNESGLDPMAPAALAVKSETALIRVVRMHNSAGDAFVGGWKVRRNSSSLIVVASGFFDIVVAQSADN